MAEDPLFKFLKSVSEKIKVEKEHRDLMENIEDVVVEPKNDPLQSAIDILKLKLAEKIEPKSAEIFTTPEISVALDTESNNKVEMAQEKDNFSDFLINLKNILAGKEIDKPKEIIKVEEQKDDKPAENVAEDNSQQPSIETSVEEPSKEEKNTYVDILDQLSNEPIASREPEKVNEIRGLIEQYAEKYFKKAAIMSEYAGGGGTDAVQYANGGTMNGDLNVNGNILSGGNNLLDLFSGGGGGGGGDPAVNTVVYTGSANWNNTYTTTNYFSAFWNAAVDELFNFYVTQTDPGSAFISEDGNYYIIANSKLDNTDLWNSAYTQTFLLSSQWSSVYVTVLGLSARWESVYTTFNQNSAKYESTFSTVASNSGSWSSVYNTYNALSASYATETLAIAYAVAL